MRDTLTMHPVDAVLHKARQLLGSTPAPEHQGASLTETVVAHPIGWDSESGDAATATSTAIDNQLNHIQTIHHNAHQAMADAAQIAQSARDKLDALETDWQHDKDTHDPNTTQGQAALLQAAQQRINQAIDIVEHAATGYGDAAARLRTYIAQLNE